MSKSGKSKRNPVAFIKPQDPAFIRRMKEQLGYKEGPNVDTKREELGFDPDNQNDKDDERPTVVVLKAGDLTEEEAVKLKVFDDEDSDETVEEGGKVLFKKPVKRAAETKEGSELRTKLEKKESSMKKVKNKSLLSFDDEADDDDGVDSD